MLLVVRAASSIFGTNVQIILGEFYGIAAMLYHLPADHPVHAPYGSPKSLVADEGCARLGNHSPRIEKVSNTSIFSPASFVDVAIIVGH